MSDAVTGHAPATVDRSYGAPTIEDMARELAKFPWYKTQAPTRANEAIGQCRFPAQADMS
jgi:hypothetical protein